MAIPLRVHFHLTPLDLQHCCVNIFSGLKICGGFSVDGKQQDGIFVKRILPGGLAEIQGFYHFIANDN